MFGRVAAALTISLIAIPALPQCGYQLVYSGQFRTSALDLALDGNNLWLATGYGVSLFDRTVDPPELVATIAVPGVTRVVRAANGIAYAGSSNAIFVISRNGRKLQIARGVDAGAAVNDLLLNGLDLYAATANGITRYDNTSLQVQSSIVTGNPNVTSLAVDGSTLYAVDGGTVDVYDISIPNFAQHTGTIPVTIRATSIKTSGGKLFISDGFQTQLFIGTAALTNLTTGSTELAPLAGNVVFMAGTDRRIFALDFTTAANPVELFRTDLAPSAGTINRITAMATTANRLYAAAGDLGLITFDTTSFAPPFPLRAFGITGATSIAATSTAIYLGRTSAGVVEYLQNASGSLTQARGWDSQVDLALDSANGFLLTSSGASVTEWALQTLALVASATLRSNVVGGVLVGQKGYVLLADHSLWSVDFTQTPAATQQVSVGSLAPTSIARSGSSVAIAGPNADGATTSAGFFSDPSQTMQTIAVPGITTTPVTLSGTTAAIFTFSGVNLIDFSSGHTKTINPAGNSIARRLLLSGTKLFEATDDTLFVIDTPSSAVTRQFALPSTPTGIVQPPDSSLVDVIGDTTVTTIAYQSLLGSPAVIPSNFGNSYYRKVSAGNNNFSLFDGRKIDIFTNALHNVGSVRPPGIVDFAMSDAGVFTLQSNGTVNAYTSEGVQIGGVQLTGSGDAQWQSINVVNGAVWVAVTQGCAAGACTQQTLVLDPHAGLTQTSSFAGGVKVVTTNGTRAYAITDIPSEVRVIDATDAAHPNALASIAAEGSQAPVSIAFSNGTVYVLGDKLYAYSEASLAKTGEFLGAFSGDTTGTTFVDQRIAIDGTCGFVTGRAPAPQFFSVPQWTPASTAAVPAAVRSIASIPGRLYILTDDSLEIWSTTALPKPPRPHPAR